MPGKPKTIDEYLASVSAEQRVVLGPIDIQVSQNSEQAK
jgi:hypothetical protein